MNAIEEHRLAPYEPVEKRGKAMSILRPEHPSRKLGDGTSCTVRGALVLH